LLYGTGKIIYGLPHYFDILPDSKLFEYLFTHDPWSPTLLFMLFACGTGFLFLWGSLVLVQKFGVCFWMTPFLAAGRVTLTLYLAHVLVGMELLEYLHLFENQSLGFAALNALGFYLVALMFATFWFKKFHYGPVEGLMRRL